MRPQRTLHSLILILILLVMTNVSVTESFAQTASRTKKAATKNTANKNSKKTNGTTNGTLTRELVVKSTDVTGMRKLEKDAVLNRLVTKTGESYTDEKIREDVRALFKSGYFVNVEVDREIKGNEVSLVYHVTEKPSIVEIVYQGNAEVKSEDLAESVGIKSYEILNMSKLKEATEKLQKLYEDKGYFLAKIEPVVEDVKKDESVRLVFKIQENDKVKVKKITILGAKKISEDTLKGNMITKEGGFFSFMSGSGAYKQEAFDRDTQALRYVYYNQGYIQAKVDRPQVYVTPDKKSIYITMRVEEGEQYNVGEIDFGGDVLFAKDELFSVIKLTPGKVFAYDVLYKDLSDLQAKYGDLGYAFANVIPRTRIDDKSLKVDLLFEFDKGNKVYFGKINVVGNSKTRDKVVRRELRVREGELYNETRRRLSLEGVQRLGFFEEVNFKTSTSPDKPDVLNMDIMVKERNTGQIQLGAGYGSVTGFTLQGSVNQTNFLGKGQNLGASLNISDTGSYYNFTFTEPYFQDTLWSLGGELYQSSDTGRTEYDEKRTGAAVSMGHPFWEDWRGIVRYKLDKTRLDPVRDKDGNPVTDYTVFPLDTANGYTSSVTTTVQYDTRNDRFMTSRGILTSLSYEYAGLGGDLKYQKGTGIFRYFKNIFWDVIWRNSLTYGQISSLGEQDPPFNQLYLLGGPYSLRGYRPYTVGKQVYSPQRYADLTGKGVPPEQAAQQAMVFFGGQKQIMYQTELQFPLINEAKIMGVVFYDVGQAEDHLIDDRFFSDVGFGIRWFSPIGPLRFEWGFPLNRDPVYHKDSMIFDFSIGTPF
ncbi:outer membrane protein assembly factor BamA [Bdellovibrio sp. HCB337]|uniref:outer membrane protein assembly factor BamA n=1 Tax=Bdellovibrio sp. HCB337 TaxID=3394358 RepID=UPI0039A6A71D